MALSRLAAEFAAEIANHDWSDAPYRMDRAGHQREDDRPGRLAPQLEPSQTDNIRMNVMWVALQVLTYEDPNIDPYEFATACGVNVFTSRGAKSKAITEGLRRVDGRICRPGTRDVDGE